MHITQPDYYDAFSCIAGACPDTCCAAWQVVLDDSHVRQYETLSGELGEQIREGMVQIEGETCFRLQSGRCCMLREDGLCTIQKELGDEALSHTCDFYPRFVTELGLMREQGLSISCPEVARIILHKAEPVSFPNHTTQEPLRYFHDIEPEQIFYVKKTRDRAIAVMQNRALPLAQRLHDILELIAQGDCVHTAALGFREALYELFLSLEPLRVDWTERLERGSTAPAPKRLDESIAWEQLFCYYIFKYALRSAMEDDFEEKLCLAVVNILFLQDLYAQGDLDLTQLVWLHAKETEHNEENMRLLSEAMAENVHFSPRNLQQLLQCL